MVLKVIGKPTIEQSCASQKLSASYNPSTGVHTVTCDVDVVTLGIALNVLQREFNKCLEGLEPSMAARVKRITEEAVSSE